MATSGLSSKIKGPRFLQLQINEEIQLKTAFKMTSDHISVIVILTLLILKYTLQHYKLYFCYNLARFRHMTDSSYALMDSKITRQVVNGF